ncbi:hypothetical protein HF295_08335 [Hujiaoplasma nucleasis]|uniref:Uncharacterized protein n=1 Tax=Hujiaoplasma nucleasis TaxID=2725268 RepID=A0A7L6N5M4_9MOLU|nr:hypothetical protein [Hujiaoplasma nucleasis]QLY40861.1 hypothetical protein HF295_08335 [Hujiaoplasma nucleasis]
MKVRRILSIFSLFIVSLVTLILITYSWLDYTYNFENDILGRTRVNYFADGDGSQTDPFIIESPEHMFNLSMLQNLGYLEDQDPNLTGIQSFYFKVADKDTGNPIIIDYSDPLIPSFYKTIPPIGDHDYPFTGVFDGNLSEVHHLTIDGSGKQDIGFFGYAGSGSIISNFFIIEPIILSNPVISEITPTFHEHNNNLVNRATGYIVGHLGVGSLLENVFVSKPFIDSDPNGDLNRSQYGLIGFNETDGGLVSASPRNSYNFTMDAPSAYAALSYAQTTYGNWYINGSSTLRLSNAISSNKLNIGYSLSTLRISQSTNDPDPVYLIDKLETDGYIIGTAQSKYSRENIDVVGLIDFSTTNYQIFQNLSAFTTPAVGSTFNPINHPDAVFLYVRPTNNPQDLGDVTSTYGGGGNFSYLSGYDANGIYQPNRIFKNKQSPGVIGFGASGITNTMIANNAWTAVVEDTDTGSLIVVDETVIPDFYVFLVAVTNGQITINNIVFNYQAPAATEETLQFISKVDFIHQDSINTIKNNLSTYDFSMMVFNYEIISGETLTVEIERLLNDNYNIFINYSVVADSFFYFDIFNVKTFPISIYINGVLYNTYTNTVISMRFESSGFTVTPT